MYNYTLLCIIIHTAQHTYVGAPTVLARLIINITYPQQFVNRQITQNFQPSHFPLLCRFNKSKKNKKTFTKPLDKSVPLWYNVYRKRERETLNRKRDNNNERIHPHTAHQWQRSIWHHPFHPLLHRPRSSIRTHRLGYHQRY